MSIFAIFSAALLAIILFWAVYHTSILFVGIRRKHKPVAESTDRLPKFSLIVPAKNEGAVISRCLKSLLNIDYPKEKMEIIVVDGDSIDTTAKICNEFAEKHKDTIQVLCEDKSKGKPVALNLALPRLTGDIVGVFDADSVPERNVLRKTATYFKDPSVAAVQGKIVSLNESQNMLTKVAAMEDKAWFQALLHGREQLNLFIPLTGSCQFIRKNVLQEMGGWAEGSLAEDVELSLELTDKGHIVKYAPDVCSGQETASRLGDLFAQRRRWYRGYMEAAFKYGRLLKHPDKKAVDAEISLFGPFLMLICLLSYFNWILSLVFAPEATLFPISTTLVVALTAATFLSVGIGMVFTVKPRKLKNIAWAPFIYLYWFMQLFIAGWAFLRLVFRRRKTWAKTNKRGIMTNNPNSEGVPI